MNDETIGKMIEEINDQDDEDVDAVCEATKANADLVGRQRSSILDVWIFERSLKGL